MWATYIKIFNSRQTLLEAGFNCKDQIILVKVVIAEVVFFLWWLQMAFIAICYMYINLFALQHIADRPGEYRTSIAHQL